jgi:hypothetical protein
MPSQRNGFFPPDPDSLRQTCLRHPDCESARINKDAVFQRMRCALEQVIEIVTEARSSGETRVLPASLYNGIKDFKVGRGQGRQPPAYCRRFAHECV